ncbi:TonB-dependent receptor [Bacteroidia bacterium]|nr:TonB-dependent receptor [Bacteroidia bacterium]
MCWSKALWLFSFFFAFVGLKAQNYSLSGFVKDSTSGESIKGAVVKNLSNGASVTTNNYGFFSLTLPSGEQSVRISAGEYEGVTLVRDVQSDEQISIYLLPRADEIDEVRIRAKRNDNVRAVDISTQSITGKVIKKIPAFLGEADVIKSIQLLPGVTTVGEGATGFNVRGGGIDQNLVLMDDAPVFNSAHLFGFFSIFNPDAVKDVQLIKGGIPAKYGGRLSSVLDVITKDGNNRDYQVNGGVGTIFSRLTFEGPVVKNKASFLVSGRRSYIDVLAKPLLNEDLEGSQFYFYDFTAKFNYDNGKDKFFVSSYIGDDLFFAANAFGVKWGNSTLSARWNHIFNDKLFSNLTYYYSRYRYNLEFNIGDDLSFDWQSYINNHSLKTDFTYYLNSKNEIGFGGSSTYYIFEPGTATAVNNLGENTFGVPNKYAMENAIYLSDDWTPNNRFTIRAGIRGSQFLYLGKSNVYTFRDPFVEGQRRFVDSVWQAGDNEVIQQYLNLEPRLGFKYQWNSYSSIKGGYNRMVQNLHLISNTAASVPFDVWSPSTNNIKPELADQYTIGYFKNFSIGKQEFESSAEVYYKDMLNQVDYVDGANLLLNELLEGELINGIGRAYGLELYVKKATGDLTGWVSYTLSRSERKSPGISDNEWYPSRFDRLHNLYIVAQYRLNKKWDLAANFVFSSGTPTTFYTGQYSIQGYTIPDAGSNDRNNVRNPNYHRLDLSATYTKKKKGKWESNWVFSVYNAYNRRNPFSIYFENNYQNTGINQAIQFSVIGSIVPAISYNFKWN